ncbi:hypothetical protein LMIY3S_04762 [Labrys miyagiensis]
MDMHPEDDDEFVPAGKARRYERENYRDSNGHLTEDSVALAFARQHAGQWRYCNDSGAWFTWTGTHWKKDGTKRAFDLVRAMSREMGDGAKKGDAKAIGRAAFARGVESFCQADRAFAVTAEAWDADPWLLGTPGGTVDLRTGNLRPSDPAEGITKLTSAAPAAMDHCPRWKQFLEESTGNDEALIRFLQQWCGYALTGDTSMHALVFIYGDGGNGKSVFLNVVSAILKDYALTAAMDAFTASRSEKHSTDLAMLQGARLVTASETEEGKKWAEARIKSLTGGDRITARFMRRDNFSFTPQFKLMIVGNHRPELENIDDAAKRRFNMLPFVRKPENPDPGLEEKLKAEAPGILRWMIDGCLDWQSEGKLLQPESVVAATQEYFSEQDVLGQWIADECHADPHNDNIEGNVSDLFTSWKTYALKASSEPKNTKWFSPAMRRKGFMPKRRNYGRMLLGIRLKPSASFHNDE